MKLTSVFLLAVCLHAAAAGYTQNVTLRVKNMPLSSVFAKLEEQTGSFFTYDQDILKNAGSVNATIVDLPLSAALDILLKGLSLAYRYEGRFIIISKKENPLVKAGKWEEPAFIPIKGSVKTSDGQALEGASISVKGGNTLVMSDRLGEFTINAQPGQTLVISYIGYEMKEVKAAAGVTLNIVLAAKTNIIDSVNVVSTGYQKIPKYQLTGAASTLSEKDYQQRIAVTGNFLENLEGKVPGLVYNSQSGELTIRGVSTFDAVKKPLIVLDGFPTEIDLRSINPNDIVSVSVLRDAAAASIYGVRASNGVIIIETRRGKSGKTVFNLRATTAIQDKPDFSYLKYASASEFIQLEADQFYISKPSTTLYQLGIYKMDPVQEILFNGPRTGVINPVLTQEQVNTQLAGLGSYDNLKEYEHLFYQRRQANNVNFDVSGGNDNSTYILGMNYVGETPVTRKSENNQFILNMANTFKFSERFNFDFRGTYTNSVDKSGNIPPYGGFFPYEHLADANGNALAVALDPGRNYSLRAITEEANIGLMAAGLYDQFYYPYRELTSNINTAKMSSLRFQGRLNAKITRWLNMDIGGSYENQNYLLDQLQLEDAFAVRTLVSGMALQDPATGKALFTNLPQGNILKRNNQKLTNYTVRAQLNLNHSFNGTEHNFSGILGAEQKKTLNTGYTTSFFGYDGQTLISKPINMGILNSTPYPAFSDLGYGTFFKSTDYFNEAETDRRFMSYYGEGTYIYKGKYVATGSFRIDQSNLFGVDPKYKNKPLWSAGLNWRMGQEDFIKRAGWIDQLQIRAATGFNGNVPSSNNGAFLILQTGLNTFLNTPEVYNDVLTPENQSLRWETTRNYNLGIDYAFLKNRISGSIDWYLKRSTDVFGQFDADPTSGFNQYNANTASIQNKGWEFMVNARNVKSNKFEWRTSVTASFNNNEVLEVKATEYDNSQLITSAGVHVKGYPLGALFSYNYGGLNSKGQPYVLDNKGNQKILSFYTATGTEEVDVTREDLIYNGVTTPKYVLGLNNQFTVGSFDLSFLFMYYGGHVMRVEQPNPGNRSYGNHPLQGSADFWKKAGDENNTVIPGFSSSSSLAPGYFQAYAVYGYQYASQFVRKADYIRLRDVILTYHAKLGLLERAGLRNTQLRFQAQNVFRYTFSGNDIDPEAINRISGIRMLETQPFYSLTFSTNF